MRTKLLILVSIVVLASGCVSDSEPEISDNEPPVDDTASNAQDPNTIRFTDNGFEPESLTIEQGETVTWIDESSMDMWVASDQHPSHTHYDGTSLREHCGNGEDAFDQCEAGEEFSFTFEQEGTWSYHNHEAFRYGGEITVE